MFVAAALGVAALTLAARGVDAAPLKDAIDQPAAPSPLAGQTTFLDIARAGERLVAVGERGHILFSDAGGAAGSWVQARVPTVVTLTAVFFIDARTGWAAGHDSVVLKTGDGGETWAVQLSKRETVPLSKAAALRRLEAADALAATDPDRAGEMKESAELALEEARIAAEKEPYNPFLDVRFEDARHGLAIGGFGYFFETRDGGASWTDALARLDNDGFLHLNAIGRFPGGALTIVGEGGQVYRSSDEGRSWSISTLPFDGSIFALAMSGTPGEAYVAGLRGHALATRDGGDTWSELDIGVTQTLLGAAAQGTTVALVGANGTAVLSRDGGRRFERLAAPSASLAGVVVVDENTVIAAGERGLYRLATGQPYEHLSATLGRAATARAPSMQRDPRQGAP